MNAIDDAKAKCRKLRAVEQSSVFPGERKIAGQLRRKLMKRHMLKPSDLDEPAPAAAEPAELDRLQIFAEEFANKFMAAIQRRISRELSPFH